MDVSSRTRGYDAARLRAGIATLVGLALIAVSVLALDRPIATWAHGLHRPPWCVALTHIADIPAPASLTALGAGGIAWLAGWRPGPWARVGLAVCLATLAAEASKDVLKVAFGRPWPETWVDNNPSWIGTHRFAFAPFHGGRGWASFPSGHTTATTAPCAALWPYAPRLRPVLMALPILVAVGLIGANFHFLGDCLAGAGLAIGCAAAANVAVAGPTR